MTAHATDRDERTVAVENASYRWAYLFMSYALLVIVMYRGLVRHEAAWDLLALVVIGGGLPLIYQALGRVLSKRAAIQMLLAGAVAVIVASLVAYGTR
jgi:hypothetical protein